MKIIGDERDLSIISIGYRKTTNALEKVFEGLQKGDKAFSMEHITALRQYHAEIVNELYGAPTSRRSNGFSGKLNRWRPKRFIVRKTPSLW